MKCITLFFVFAVLSLSTVCAQMKVISGTVLDEYDEPLTGATVRETNSQSATTTDLDGSFSLQVNANSETLTVSFIGMKTVVANIKPNMLVVMEYDATLLSEIVTVGYYQKKQGAITGSVGVIKENTLKQPVANVTQMLQGTTPGVYAVSTSGKPGAGADIKIRGVGSINSGSSPLYIIDGLPVAASDFNMLSSTDIQNITVLKDASATALYGSRGANGVVLVTTKKGSESETILNYKGEYGFSKLSKGNWEMMNTAEKLQYEIATGIIDPNTSSGQNLIANRSKYDFDQFDEVFETPSTQSHEVSVTGGNQKTKFYISAGYFEQGGIVERSDFRRITGSVNLDHKANKWLALGTNIYLVQSKDNSPITPDASSGYGSNLQNPVNLALRLNPYESLKDDNGNYVPYLDTYGSANPLREAELGDLVNNRFRVRSQSYVEVTPMADLKIRSAIGFTTNQTRFKEYMSPEAYWGSSYNGYSTRANTFDYMIIQNNQLTYSKKINKHNTAFILGTEILKEKTEKMNVGAYNVTHPYFQELSQYLTILPGGWGSSISEHSLVSFYGIANYDYDNKYFLDLSIRRDGDSRFQEDGRWGNFWSVGGQWNLKAESFMDDITVLSMAKLRASVGTQGNSNVGNYISRGLYNLSGSYMGNPSSSQQTFGGSDLTWEKSTAYNVGVDVGVIENRFRAHLDLYRRDINDMYLDVPVTLTSGLGSRFENVADMHNKGFEMTLSADVVRTKDWLFNIEGNLSLYKNKITHLNSNSDQIVGDTYIMKVGHSMGQLYMVRWAGVNPVNGDPLWYDANGNITNQFSDDDAVMLDGKNYLPTKTAGLIFNVSYKGIGLQAIFSSIWDIYGINNSLYFIELDNGAYAQKYNHTTRSMDFWREPGDVTEFPRLNSGAQQFDSRIVENRSFLRLKNLVVSYNFNQKTLAPLKVVRNARIYAMGQNLWTLTDYRGYDPEVSTISDLGSYPASRTFTFGLELSF